MPWTVAANLEHDDLYISYYHDGGCYGSVAYTEGAVARGCGHGNDPRVTAGVAASHRRHRIQTGNIATSRIAPVT